MIVPEPDLIAIDDELSSVVTESLRSLSPASTVPHDDVLSSEPVRCDCTWDLSRGSRNGISGKHVERMRQAKQKAMERKELERKVQFVISKLLSAKYACKHPFMFIRRNANFIAAFRESTARNK